MVTGMSLIFHSDNYFVQAFCLGVGFLGFFFIGAANYFIYERIVREEYICSEAERWLAEQRTKTHPTKPYKALRRFALWIPTVTVVLACVFFDGIWAFGSHLLHPGRGSLIGYEVSIPLNWTLRYNDLDANGSGAHSIVVAERYRSLLLAGSGLYIGRRPFSVSSMNFRSTPAGDPRATKPATTIISERTMLFGKTTIVCREEVPPRWMTSARYINCSTPTGDFWGRFNGNDQDADEFYRVIGSVKSRN